MVKTHSGGQSGQVGLIVLLVGAVLMTIGLGVASQSVMEINTASLETDSSQAFNAAEQGIEAALQNSLYQSAEETISGYNVNVQITPQLDKYEGTILEGHSAQLDMTGVSGLELTWSDLGCGVGHTAIVVTFIGAGGGSLTRQAYGRHCELGDNFIEASCNEASCTVTPDLDPSLAYVRIKAIYGDTQLTAGLTGTNLPVQYYEITSTATSQNSPEARSVQVSKSVASAPSIFDYALFSGADLATSP